MQGRMLVGAGALSLLLVGGSAHAQGSSVMTHGSCATALAGAQVASPCDDGSAILFNPAAVATQPNGVVSAGWTGIRTGGTFTYNNTLAQIEREETTTSVPFAYVTAPVMEGISAGIGVFAPYGLGVDWPVCAVNQLPNDCDEQNFEGRFTSYDTSLRNIYIQPTVSWQVSRHLSFGAGVDFVRSSIEINQRADLAFAPTGSVNPATGAPILFGNLGIPAGTDFADVQLSGDDWGYGYHLGALFRVTDYFSVGARYLSTVDVDYEEGEATFEQVRTGIVLSEGNPLGLPGNTPLDAVLAQQFAAGGPLVAQGVRTGFTLPDQLVVGLALTPVPQLTLLADYQWTGWSEWTESGIEFETAPAQTLVLDYQDTDTWRLGAEFQAAEALALRAGFIYNTAAQREFSVSPLLPEAERNYYSVGLGYEITPGLQVDLGYQHVDQSDRAGRVRPRPAGASDAQLEALNVGVYSADASVFNITLSYGFGGR